MPIQIDKIDYTRGCQPLKKSVNAVPLRDKEIAFKNGAGDSFQKAATLEQKYDFACRVAAYYKTKYETLLNNKSCCV